MIGVEVIARTFPGEPLCRSIVEDDDGDVARMVMIERAPIRGDDAEDRTLQPRVDRRVNATSIRRARRVMARLLRLFEHVFDEVRRDRRAIVATQRQSLGARGREIAGRQPAVRGHRRENPPLARHGGRRAAPRIATLGPRPDARTRRCTP